MVVAVLAGLLAVDFFFIWQSLQFSSVFHIAIFSSIFLLLTYQKNQNYLVLFFIIGGVTSFFDLLTVPLITLGLPLIVYLQLSKKGIKDLACNSISWAIGYLLLWATKWVIVEYFFVPGAIQTSIDQIVNRTITKADPEFNHINTIKRNVFQLIGYDKRNKIVDLASAVFMGGFFMRYVNFKQVKLKSLLPWIIIGIMPYAWYLVAANHSYLHV